MAWWSIIKGFRIQNFFIWLLVSSYDLILLFSHPDQFSFFLLQKDFAQGRHLKGCFGISRFGGDGLPRACARMGEWQNLARTDEGREEAPDVPTWSNVLPSQPYKCCHQFVGSSPSVEKVGTGIEVPFATPWWLNPGGDQLVPKMWTLHRRESPLQVQCGA